MERTDWHDEAERASCVAWRDGSMRRQLSETSAWTMVTSPQALGMIRADYSEVGRKALQGEVGKDLVKLPVRATVGRRQ